MRLPKTTTGVVAVAVFACSGGNAALGGVIEFTDPLEWQAAVWAFTTIDFTGFPAGTVITDQYADLGVLFIDGFYTIKPFDPFLFPNDGWGLDGNGDITVAFDTPMAWIGVDYPGHMHSDLHRDGVLIYESSDFFAGGVGNFAGLVSSKLFDMAVLMDLPPSAEAEIDDLHFGVPAPGALALFALAALRPRRRRR